MFLLLLYYSLYDSRLIQLIDDTKTRTDPFRHSKEDTRLRLEYQLDLSSDILRSIEGKSNPYTFMSLDRLYNRFTEIYQNYHNFPQSTTI